MNFKRQFGISLGFLSSLALGSIGCAMDQEMDSQNNGFIRAENTGPESITDVIVLTGQSNALATHSRMEKGNPADESNSAVYAYNEDVGWQVASLDQNWFNYWPVGWERPSVNSAALHAAKAIVKKDPRRVVGIVMAAKGDRSIDLWDAGEEMDNDLDKQVFNALESIPASKVNLVLWMQGEADGSRSDYGGKLESLISRMREKNWGNSETNFVCSETKGNQSINKYLMALNDDADPRTGCVKASDQVTDDGIHFDTSSIRTIGKRQGLHYLELEGDTIVDGPDAGQPEEMPDSGMQTPGPDAGNNLGMDAGSGPDVDAGTEVDLCEFHDFFC